MSDLELDAETPFLAALRNPIVQAFESQRAANPVGTKTVGPAAGPLTIYRLGHGHDHRGATWFDPINQVVWLCGYRLHRSGAPDDAFPYFRGLIRNCLILPTVDDYEELFADRGRRFAETVNDGAQTLLAMARSHPGSESVGLLGGDQPAGVVVEVVETLEETYVSMSVRGLDHTRLVIILQAFYPEASFAEWELIDRLPTRPIRAEQAEIAYRILREETS